MFGIGKCIQRDWSYEGRRSSCNGTVRICISGEWESFRKI